MDELISRRSAIDGLDRHRVEHRHLNDWQVGWNEALDWVQDIYLEDLPSVQPTLYGYNIEHLGLIARVLQKENLPPERIVEVLTDIGRIVAIVRDEFEESLRKAVEQCMT